MTDLLMNACSRFDYARRRLTCFVRTHDMYSERRCDADLYGESWCQRCGEYEPEHWLPDNDDLRANLLLLFRGTWSERPCAARGALQWLAHYAKRPLRAIKGAK